jgi:hypothetical protein
MAIVTAFHFTAQTGAIDYAEPKAPSNFYRYTLPAACLGRVKLAIDAAAVGSGGLEYPADFLVWLAANDAPRAALTCRHCAKPCPPQHVTCDGSECQEAEYHANAERAAMRRRTRR